MPRKYGTIIGIDPDVKLSGVSVLDCESRTLELHTFSFPEMVDTIHALYASRPKPFTVVIEAGYLNKPIWHLKQFEKPSIAAAIGASVGRNQQVAHDLVSCLDYLGIPYDTIKPLVKIWNGPDRKITHEELIRELKLYRIRHTITRSNQDGRDAVLITLAYL